MFTIASPRCIGIGALLLGLGIAAGAFGAHALKGHLDSAMMNVYEKAVLYQLINSLGLIALGVGAVALRNESVMKPALFIVLGIVIFSGSLYGLTLSGQRWLGAVTPLGGTVLIVGWFWTAWIFLRA